MGCDWSQIDPNTLSGRLLRLPLRLVPKRSVVRVLSGLNRGMKWIVGASIHGCWIGSYEPSKQRSLARQVQPGMKVFDIGANAGFYTLAFSRLVGEGGHVWAFEPLAENVHNLLRHIELNGLRNVTVMQAAVADRAGFVEFQVAESNSMGSITGAATGYKVPAVSLDDLIDRGVVPLPDLIKMDVEGAESRVLEGAKGLLRARTTVLFIALHGEQQKERCREILEAAGYEVYLLTGTKLSGAALAEDEIYALPRQGDANGRRCTVPPRRI